MPLDPAQYSEAVTLPGDTGRVREAGDAHGLPSCFFCDVLLKCVYVHFLL